MSNGSVWIIAPVVLLGIIAWFIAVKGRRSAPEYIRSEGSTMAVIVIGEAFVLPGRGKKASPTLSAIDIGYDVHFVVRRDGRIIDTAVLEPMQAADKGPRFAGFRRIAPDDPEVLSATDFDPADQIIFTVPTVISTSQFWDQMTARMTA